MKSVEEWMRFAPTPPELVDPYRWHVFLSYRSVNRPWVVNLYDIIRGHGCEVYLDQCALVAGDALINELETALARSRAGVMIWSGASAASDWCRREYQTMERLAAANPTFRFVPVRLDASALPLFADNRLFLDFSAYPSGPNGGELLRLLHAVGGKPMSPEAMRFATEQDEVSKHASVAIRAAVRNGFPHQLQRLFEQGGLPWETSAVLGCEAAEGLLELDAHDAALAILRELSNRFPRAIRPRQLQALALARRGGDGDLEEAQTLLGTLEAEGHDDPETLGIYGRTWMDRYERSRDVAHLEQSRDCYVRAFEKAQDDFYTGINAAAKSVFLGRDENLEAAAEYAERVQRIVGSEPIPGDYWKTATVAEAFLIQRRYRDAATIYKKAVASARSKLGNHRSTWKQACRLMDKLGPSREERALVRKAFEHLPDCTGTSPA